MNRKPRLFQPLALDIDPRHVVVKGAIKTGVVFILDNAGIVSLADLEGPGMTTNFR